jgi:hypothetical protein
MPLFRKKCTQELNAWTPETDMKGVSISHFDIINGSPKVGDMIAINKNDSSDRWLVAEKFFNDNYEPA